MLKFTKQTWAGLVIGIGIGLMLGAALVELEWMTSTRKAWVSLVGALLFGAGLFLAKKSA